MQWCLHLRYQCDDVCTCATNAMMSAPPIHAYLYMVTLLCARCGACGGVSDDVQQCAVSLRALLVSQEHKTLV